MKKLTLTFLLVFLASKNYSQAWTLLPGGSLNGPVYSLIKFGPYIWVGGNFNSGGVVSGPYVIRHDGFQWITTPSTSGVAFGFTVYSNELYALGGFDVGLIHYGVMKWNGVGWTPLAQLPSGEYMQTGASYNGELIVGGRFNMVDGIPMQSLAKWNGVVWVPFCGGITENNATSAEIKVLYSAKGWLYAGGAFTKICGVNSPNAAKWNGATWITLPVAGGSTSYTSYGTDIIIGGAFTSAGSVISHAIAKEDTVSVGDWLQMIPGDGGVKMTASSLAVWNNRLYIAGGHTIGGGGTDVWNCGYWASGVWTPDHLGLNSNSLVLALYTDPVTNVLYAGGTFKTQTGDTADYIVYKSNSPLPIELGAFDVRCNTYHDCVELEWTTFSEHDNLGFEIERSLDARSFERVSFVPGFDNTNIIHNYEFCDYGFVPGVSYYRLKQIDYSGECSYSNVAVARCGKKHVAETSAEMTHDLVAIDGNFDYKILSMMGQCVRQGTAHSGSISFGQFSNGLYLLVVQDHGQAVSRKVIKY